MNKHLIVVSIDAMVFEDLEYCRSLPNFKKLIEGGSVIERVRTIYPSLTHPVHATLITGAPAGVTGIVNNSVFNPEAPDVGEGVWYNFLGQIRCDTLLHAAKRAGLTTAVATWPVTNGVGEVIDYLVPCALNVDFRGFEGEPLEAYRALGATDSVMDIIAEAVRRFGWENKHPEVEKFQAYCCAEIIKRYKPNLLLTHPSYVDDRRHAGGVFGEGVRHALRETDRWLGDLLRALSEAGIEDSTDIVLLSDHGQINISRSISPNVYLADAGLITLGEAGEVVEWRAYCKSAGASAHVYLSDPADKALCDRVYELLSDMAKEGIYGFERVYTSEELRERYGLYGEFSFALETDGYTSFGEWTRRPSVRGFDTSDYRFGRGTHGHAPEKGPQPTLVASGPSFRQGAVLGECSVLDHAPTIAAALGIELPSARGTKRSEILK